MKSFNNLSDAFLNWYFRYNPIKSSQYDIGDNHYQYTSYESARRDEYYADISRFLIELSQIDETKIPFDSRIDYKILYSNLQKMKYEAEHHRDLDWNTFLPIYEIYNGLFFMIEGKSYDMELTVQSILSRLEDIPTILNDVKQTLVGYSPVHISYTNQIINKLVIYLNRIPLELNSDNLTLDKIDLLIDKSIDSLQEFQDWLDEKIILKEKIKFPMNLDLLNSGFKYYIGSKYSPEAVYDMALKKINNLHNRLFNVSLPIYLDYNDEPIWLDYDDTLEVINWTIKYINSKSENIIDNSQVLSQYYLSITNIENFNNNKILIEQKSNKKIKLQFSSEYNIDIYSNFLFNHLPIDPNSNIVYNIKSPDEKNNNYYLTKPQIDIVNAQNIIPGYLTQINHAKTNSSKIRYIFPDPISMKGWRIFSMKTLIEEGFMDWDSQYSILKILEIIKVVAKTIVENQYYSGMMSRNDVIKYLNKMSFVDRIMAENFLKIMDLYYFSGTQAFVGLQEFNSILVQYKNRYGDEFNLLDFHNLILVEGVIPLYELKKQIITN